jgi:hypothetical protein
LPYLFIAFEHLLAGWAVKDEFQFMLYVGLTERVGHQFCHHLTVCNEVDKRDVFHFQHFFAYPTCKEW